MQENAVAPGVEREVIVRTARLIVTSWSIEDVGPLHEVHLEPETMQFVRNGRPETRAEVEQLVGQYMVEHAARGWTKWRLADHEDRLGGRAGFGGSSTRRGIAYMIRRSHRGQGLATEVAEALVGWHLTHAPTVPLRALVVIGNDPSVRVLEKVGFSEVDQESSGGTMCRAFVYPSTA